MTSFPNVRQEIDRLVVEINDRLPDGFHGHYDNLNGHSYTITKRDKDHTIVFQWIFKCRDYNNLDILRRNIKTVLLVLEFEGFINSD